MFAGNPWQGMMTRREVLDEFCRRAVARAKLAVGLAADRYAMIHFGWVLGLENGEDPAEHIEEFAHELALAENADREDPT